MKKNNLYISVMGTMGSGKTTASRIIAKAFKLKLIEENFGENLFLPRFYKDMKRWAFHSQTFFLMEKIAQMMETSKIIHKKSFIQDTPIQQDAFSYAKAQHVLGNIDDAEWRLYQKIYYSFEPHFPTSDLIIYLDTSIPVLVKRIEARGRSYEKKIPKSYIELLDMLNLKWIRNIKDVKVLKINTDNLNIVRSEFAKKEFIQIVKSKL